MASLDWLFLPIACYATPTAMFQDRMDVDVGSLMSYLQARFSSKVW